VSRGREENAELSAAIRETSRSRVQAIRDREVDALVESFYLPDARLMAPGRPEVRGHKELRSFWRSEYERGLVTLNLEPIEIDGAADLAYEIGRYDLMVRLEGRSPFRDSGKYVVVYRRTAGGSWKAAADIFNSDQRRY
jgi:ketosteroid isomerase-like protein